MLHIPIVFSLTGVPGVYIHSIIGSENDLEGLEKKGENRSINREKFDYKTIVEELTGKPLRNLVYNGMTYLMKCRSNEPVLSLESLQEIIDLHSRVFCVIRKNGLRKVLLLTNVTGFAQKIDLPFEGSDLLTGEFKSGNITMPPF